MTDKPNERRLPPPAFPPGHRRHLHKNSSGSANEAPHPGVRRDGLISPDEPIPLRRDSLESAFISPDEPIPERRLELAGPFAEYANPVPGEGEGEVVSMDMDTHTDPVDVVSRGDPHVLELIETVAKLAESLRRKGEAGLRIRPGMSRFETTLRAYCVGFLAGRRAEQTVGADDEDE